MEKEDESLL